MWTELRRLTLIDWMVALVIGLFVLYVFVLPTLSYLGG